MPRLIKTSLCQWRSHKIPLEFYKCLMHLLMNYWAVFQLVDILFSKIVMNKAGYTANP